MKPWMMLGQDAPVALKTTGVVLAATAAPHALGYNEWLNAIVGVGFTTVGMAAAGSALSFAFGSLGKNKPKLFAQAICACVAGAAAVTAIPHFFRLDPVAVAVQPVVGFFYALFARWMMPLIIDVLPMLIRRQLNIPAKTE